MKIGITFGCFDLLHAGHCLMLEEAKKYCDHLIVGLQVDPSIERKSKNKPIQSLYERYVQLKSIKFVDDIIPYQYEKEIDEILLTILPDVRIIGSDYIDKDFSGKSTCLSIGTEIIYNNRYHNFSTTDIRKRIEK